MTTEKCTDRIATEWGDRKESISALTDREIKDYPISFDYVDPDTFGNHEGYSRYQMSWGGPQDEIRFYNDNKVTYAFLDWYDSAEIDITKDAITKRLRKIYNV
tara:strand:- start:721 stop:1029 length:309 start_codon:yes stop_codon:yes gene_type:complete